MKKTNVDMLTGSITKGLLALTIPIMIMNVFQCLFGIFDMTILRIFADDNAVGAVGACGSLIVLCTSLLFGLSAGANVVVAKRVGAKDFDRVGKSTMTSVFVAIFGGGLLMIMGVLFAKTFLEMTNCPETLLASATQYFKIYFYGMPIIMLYNFSGAILRAIGDTKRPMYFLMIGCIAKIIFTIIFVILFGNPVASVAFATIASNTIGCGLTIITLLNNKDILCLDFKKNQFDFMELKEILFNGIPAGIQSALYCFANVVIATAVNSFGADATTGIAIANQFDGILYQISLAPSLATIPYVSQNIGAGNISRVKQIAVKATLVTTIFGATLGSLSAIFSKELSSLMTASPAVIQYSRQKMVLISSTYFICGINEVLGGVLKGMRKPFPPTITSLIFLCLLRFIWVYWIFPFFPNLTFLYTVWPVGWTLSILALLAVYIPAIRKLQRKVESGETLVEA